MTNCLFSKNTKYVTLPLQDKSWFLVLKSNHKANNSGEWVSCELSNSITHAWTQATLSLVLLLQKGEKFPKTEIWKKQNMGRQEIWVIIPTIGSPSLLFILNLGFLLELNMIWKWGVFSYHKYAIFWFPFLLISLSNTLKSYSM